MQGNSDIEKYRDIIDLPHHTSTTRSRMPILDRAAQFSPFQALSGYDAAIRESGRPTEDKIELDDDSCAVLDEKLRIIMKRMSEQPEITITYFQPDARKDGGAYVSVTGYVKKLDLCERLIIMGDGKQIAMEHIQEITGEIFGGGL